MEKESSNPSTSGRLKVAVITPSDFAAIVKKNWELCPLYDTDPPQVPTNSCGIESSAIESIGRETQRITRKMARIFVLLLANRQNVIKEWL